MSAEAVLDTVAEDLEAPDDPAATLGDSNGDETAAETADDPAAELGDDPAAELGDQEADD